MANTTTELDQRIIVCIATCQERIQAVKMERGRMPYPHEPGFDVERDERFLGVIQPLEAFVQLLQRTQTDRVCHRSLKELPALKQRAQADITSPIYTSRRTYALQRRETWREIIILIDGLLLPTTGNCP